MKIWCWKSDPQASGGGTWLSELRKFCCRVEGLLEVSSSCLARFFEVIAMVLSDLHGSLSNLVLWYTHTHTQREGEREHMFICYIKHTRIQMLYNTNQLLLTVTSNLLHIVTSISHWFFQVVEDISQPLPFDVPMVLIKPPQGCATAEVYKVI